MGHVKATNCPVATQALSTFFMVAVPLSPTFAIAVSLYTVRVFLTVSNSLSTSVGYVLIGDHLLALPFYIATVFHVFSITTFWFKDTKLPEDAASLAQVLAQSSSLDGSEEMR